MDSYKLHFIPLGGIVGVTKNMYVYELYRGEELQDILLIDCGIGFPPEQEFGIYHAIPDIGYLKDKVDKIRAMLFTHCHEDHIGAIRFHYNDLGKPPMYASKLTSVFLQNKFKEFNMSPKITQVDYDRYYTFGGFKVKYIRMTHSIPDTTHILISCPAGTFYHGSDYKIDLTPPFGPAPDFFEITKAGKEGVTCLLSDSLGSDREGFTLSESSVGKTFEEEIRTAKGKFFMTTFASNISRIRQCAEAAVKFNRKICLLGRSMKQNTRAARQIGYFPIPESFLIDEKEVKKYRPNHVCIICTGSQGQIGSALSRLAAEDNKQIRIDKGDKVVFSCDPIPGNEEVVYEMIEHLYVLGADVRYSDVQEQLHASGHGSQGDLKMLMRLVGAEYLVPIGGTIRHQRHYRELAREMDYKDDQIFLLNEGDTIWFENGKVKKGEQVQTKNIYVDAYGVGDVGETILRDRMTLSKEGFVFAVLKLDGNGKLVDRPEFTARGFIFGNLDEIFEGAAELLEEVYKKAQNPPLKRDITARLERYFYSKTNKEPLVCLHTLRV